ncbi:MAG: 3-dehydroquinate synthase [Synergistaceae bacterium]|nr:3-dehydroquinate synthase [Synergistaceae bacterium]
MAEGVKTIAAGTPENKYDILIGEHLLDDLGGMLANLRPEGRAALVTDENVWAAHGARCSSSLSRVGLDFEPIPLPPGEGSKSLRELAGLYDAFANIPLSRGGVVIAFGGGVVGDIGGFAAATWMRGVPLVQVPTTLLAQVDSSVGGKTAINIPQGKNLAGAFYQPKLVVIDTKTLETLPEREIKSGMAEVIKYGAISSAGLFESLSGRVEEGSLSGVIRECCRIKSGIVERDERDFGERILLNFGHTFGHAVEKRFGFERYRHGEAVAYGMAMAARVGERMGVTEIGTSDALKRLLSIHGLDTVLPCDPSELLPMLAADKKSAEGGVRMVFLRRIGEAFTRRVEFSELGKLMKDAVTA